MDWISFKLCMNQIIRMVWQNWLGVFSNPNCSWKKLIFLMNPTLGLFGGLQVGWACLRCEFRMMSFLTWGHWFIWGGMLWSLWCGGCVVVVVVEIRVKGYSTLPSSMVYSRLFVTKKGLTTETVRAQQRPGVGGTQLLWHVSQGIKPHLPGGDVLGCGNGDH